MPYSPEHKQQTRARIVETARILFNRHGFSDVSIDAIMAEAGLTRGGFYSHFKNKAELFAETVDSFLHGRGAEWRRSAGVDTSIGGPAMAQQMIDGYLSNEHLGDLDGQCPMIALPSDVARRDQQVQQSYQNLFSAMVNLFEHNLDTNEQQSRQDALSLAALCVGGMVLARTLADAELANEVRQAAQATAIEMCNL